MKISAGKENAAVQLLIQGLTIRKVAAQVGISSTAVGRIAQKNLPERVGGKAGRPSLLSETDKRKITRDITSGKFDTAVQVTKSLANDSGVIVSAATEKTEATSPWGDSLFLASSSRFHL